MIDQVARSSVQRGTRDREGRPGAVASAGMVGETISDHEADCHTYKSGTEGPCSKLEVSLEKKKKN